jgi:hypothetical protein
MRSDKDGRASSASREHAENATKVHSLQAATDSYCWVQREDGAEGLNEGQHSADRCV